MKSFLIVLALVIIFSLAVWWIAQNGGWNSEEGCHGDCKACADRCEEQKKLARIRKKKALDEAAAEAERIAAEHLESGAPIVTPQPEDVVRMPENKA